ncbi:hypothetical protein BYT27DRAFT_7234511 [Phlegmacium glaucopus]|nr:hypothetical protein BYT27DRAFT_7234511 [Phlegmacium glaucopus]
MFRKVTQFLLRWGIETHGISPIPTEKRIDRRIHQMFFIWFSVNSNTPAFGTGSSRPAFFALGIRDSLLVIFVVDVIAVCGPKLGMRAMVQCRFLGYYAAAILSTLNVFSSQSFLILNCIIGGQTLATVSHKLDDTLGIVIIGLISFVNFVWIPNVIAFPVLLGVAGRHLNPTTFLAVPPPSAAQIISFGSLVASSIISWCAFTPDYGVYHDAKASIMKIFIYSYLGFLLPMLAWNMIRAAFAAATPSIPSWITGFQEGSNVGGLLAAVLAPAGGFGKFLLVLIALSTSSACAPTIYTFVPRYVFTVMSTAILIPLAIIGAGHFYTVLVNILSVIGYWSTIFAAIILTEHFLFCKNNFNSYQIQDWDKPSKLPIGIAALLSFLGGFGIVIPSMSQVWYIGPIAKAGTGDIGVLTGAVVGAALYVILRALEKRIFLGH